MENDKQNFQKTCLRCKHLNDNSNNFCTFCGTPIRNICTNRTCENYLIDKTLADNAVFCPVCGYETLFKVHGLVSSPLEPSEEDLPF